MKKVHFDKLVTVHNLYESNAYRKARRGKWMRCAQRRYQRSNCTFIKRFFCLPCISCNK